VVDATGAQQPEHVLDTRIAGPVGLLAGGAGPRSTPTATASNIWFSSPSRLPT
jgi:hypothetical protein